MTGLVHHVNNCTLLPAFVKQKSGRELSSKVLKYVIIVCNKLIYHLCIYNGTSYVPIPGRREKRMIHNFVCCMDQRRDSS